MLRRQLAGLIAATTTAMTVVCAFSLGFAGPAEKSKHQPPSGATAKHVEEAGPAPTNREAEKRETQIGKMLAEYDLKPPPSPSIPDDPPPHEGAMISLSYVVEPPDLVIVEVLDALPGRPISGERLVRPDGKIDLGFYGELYVRGMTPEQVKVAIIKHLRKYLSDDVLGLEISTVQMQMEKAPLPEPPAPARNPLEDHGNAKEKTKPRSSFLRQPSSPRRGGTRLASRVRVGARSPVNANRSRIVRVSTHDQEPPAPAPNPIQIPVGGQGKVTITIEFDGQNAPRAGNPQIVPMPREVPNEGDGDDLKWTVVPPAESDRIFVDITAYNSKSFYVLGDLQVTGKISWTGNETVLDAIQYGGGLVPTAEPKDIRLVRPGRGGKPAKIYKVDLAAIQEKGDVVSNYQIFPNDRLIVGRNEVVKKTVAMDRLAAPLSTATASIQSIANMLRAVQLVDQANGGKILKDLVDFWVKEASRKGDLKFDEDTLRDALLQKLNPPVPPKP